MAKAIVIYGSTTGNTEILSGAVEKGLQKGGVEVTVMNVTKAELDNLGEFDLIVLGCSTWEEGELQEDFIPFYDAMTKDHFDQRKVAVFGPGDSEMYPDFFCEAITLIETKLKECGAEIVTESLRVDGDIDPALADAENWGLKVVTSV